MYVLTHVCAYVYVRVGQRFRNRVRALRQLAPGTADMISQWWRVVTSCWGLLKASYSGLMGSH